MLVNMREMLQDAQRHGYAVGLFNTVTLEMARGVLAAAEDLHAPVILGTAEVLLTYAPLDAVADMLLPMARRAGVPVAVHFDHGLTEANMFRALRAGFSSVMYDCSALPLEENTARVAAMAQIAHDLDCTIEAELGHVGSNAAPDGGDRFTDPAQAADYAARTGVDALAVAIGTAHGVYRSAPQLDIGRLDEIAAAVEAPLVLHGGSGLTEQDFCSCIRHGIRKVNIFKDINLAALRAAREAYAPGTGMSAAIPAVVSAVREAAAEKIRIFGSEGRG